MATFWLVQWS